MTWVKLDDQLPDHPKIAMAGPLAGWLYVCGLCYCNRHLTDGHIPRSVAHTLVDYSGIDLATEPGSENTQYLHEPSCQFFCEVLVENGLWKTTKRGYKVHHYLDFQPSKADVEKERKSWKERQTRSRMSRRDSPVTHEGVTGGVTPNVTRESGSPVPVPVPKIKTVPSVPSAEASYAARHGTERHGSETTGDQPIGQQTAAILGLAELLREIP